MAIVYPMKFVIAILVSVLSVACAFPVQSGWIGDERFTPAEREEILKGAAFLAVSTGTDPVEITWGPMPIVGRGRTIRKSDLPEGTGGLGGENGAIDLDPWQCEGGRLAPAAAHELAHVLGLGHLPEGEEGLMGRQILTLRWTSADQTLCVKDGVCH